MRPVDEEAGTEAALMVDALDTSFQIAQGSVGRVQDYSTRPRQAVPERSIQGALRIDNKTRRCRPRLSRIKDEFRRNRRFWWPQDPSAADRC